MKIEKVNDHQIRCTLSETELAKRNLKLSEIAYGNEKVKELFRDMMHQASYELGFEAEDIPLMIEVIPLAKRVVIVITKVEDPEELDTRFSKFAPSVHDDEDGASSFGDVLNSITENADDVIDLFRKIQDSQSAITDTTDDKKEVPTEKTPTTRLYTFMTLGDVTRAARACKSYCGNNSLYKNLQKGTYTLVFTMGDHTLEEYISYCGLLSEYATASKYSPAVVAYMDEHFEPVVMKQALQNLTLQ